MRNVLVTMFLISWLYSPCLPFAPRVQAVPAHKYILIDNAKCQFFEDASVMDVLKPMLDTFDRGLTFTALNVPEVVEQYSVYVSRRSDENKYFEYPVLRENHRDDLPSVLLELGYHHSNFAGDVYLFDKRTKKSQPLILGGRRIGCVRGAFFELSLFLQIRPLPTFTVIDPDANPKSKCFRLNNCQAKYDKRMEKICACYA